MEGQISSPRLNLVLTSPPFRLRPPLEPSCVVGAIPSISDHAFVLQMALNAGTGSAILKRVRKRGVVASYPGTPWTTYCTPFFPHTHDLYSGHVLQRGTISLLTGCSLQRRVNVPKSYRCPFENFPIYTALALPI